VLAIAGVATAAVVLFALPLALLVPRTYRDEELLRLQRDTFSATRSIDVSPESGDPIELPRSSDVLGVYDLAGRLVSGRGPARADSVVAAALRTGAPAEAAADGQLMVAVPLVIREKVAGAVRAQRTDARAAHDARHALRLIAAAAAALVLLATLVAWLLGRRLVAPLDRLSTAARRLGDGDFTSRAPRAGVGELDAVADALDTTAQRLDELVSRERTFSADASHQLRTPLAALRIELEAEPPGVPEALGQVDRLEGTIDTLLAVVREAPRRDATCDLVVLADELAARWRGPLARASRPLRIAVRTADPHARASGPVLAQVLDVLVDNALRHGAGPVSVTIRDAAGSVAIDVADEGHGFGGDPETAFVRRANGDGHGIGLALARSLVAAEGGRLLVTHAAPSPVLTVLLTRNS
jgi:signal transduction histidine kinase